MVTAQSANMDIGDYCASMDRNEIVVNSHYQRSDRVWPDTARSYLIESILLGYPVPKFYLHSIADAKNRKTIKEIVDGQQRSRAIHDFLNDAFVLSNTLDTEELRGHTYSTLHEDWQGKFITYSLSIDQFVGATPAEVRQVFRRMNSYTVPLNPEELRHAENQGAFKWFISNIASLYSNNLLELGVFSDKAIVRMQDLKLYTEICCAIDGGVSTTSKRNLNAIYRRFDVSFPNEKHYDRYLKRSFDLISIMQFLKGSNLAKPYQIYSLAVAIIQLSADRTSKGKSADFSLSLTQAEGAMLDLSSALELDKEDTKASPVRAFIDASAERTNVKDQRQKRIDTYRTILEDSIL